MIFVNDAVMKTCDSCDTFEGDGSDILETGNRGALARRFTRFMPLDNGLKSF
jgi:hypothetical protein